MQRTRGGTSTWARDCRWQGEGEGCRSAVWFVAALKGAGTSLGRLCAAISAKYRDCSGSAKYRDCSGLAWFRKEGRIGRRVGVQERGDDILRGPCLWGKGWFAPGERFERYGARR